MLNQSTISNPPFMPEVRLTAPIRITSNEEELTIIIEYVADPRDVVRRLELQIP